MARLARADLVDPAEVAVFYCFHRCVRRSYLCGDDPDTGRNYDDRKRWLEERLTFLASAFGIDLIGFAIMSCRWISSLHALRVGVPDETCMGGCVRSRESNAEMSHDVCGCFLLIQIRREKFCSQFLYWAHHLSARPTDRLLRWCRQQRGQSIRVYCPRAQRWNSTVSFSSRERSA